MLRHIVYFLLLLGVGLSFPVLLQSQTQPLPEWNQFRGPGHDNKSPVTGIAPSWPDDGPKLLWKRDHLGDGYSNVSFCGDKMYTMGDLGEACQLLALDRVTGKLLWSKKVGHAGQLGGYAGPRATPAVDGKLVFAYSQFGDLVCFDAEKGDELWRKNVASEYGGKQMGVWGFSSSPILDGDLLLLPIGGQDGTVVAFRKDGQLAWRTTEIKDEAPYGCVVPVTIFGQKQYLLYTMSGLWAINPENGKVLWHGEKIAKDAISNDPIIWEDKSPGTAAAFGMIMMDNGEGSTGFRVTENAGESGGFVVETSFVDKQLNNHNCGLVLHEGSVYVTTNRGLHCLDIKTGKMAWQHRCVGKGALTFVDGFLIVRSEKGDGTIVLVEATPEEYREKGRFDQPDRSDKNSWTYPVIVDGKLYIRDQNVLLCYDLLCYD